MPAFSFTDSRDTLSATGTNPDEVFANAFAANLLMPAPLVRELRGAGYQPEHLAERFGVSAGAMGFRLRNLHLL